MPLHLKHKKLIQRTIKYFYYANTKDKTQTSVSLGQSFFFFFYEAKLIILLCIVEVKKTNLSQQTIY
jgi:hypothetical protein